MARKVIGGFPPDLDLVAGFRIRLTAVDANTGALVSGVNVSNVAIIALPLVPATADTEATLPDVAPLFVPVPVQ